MDITKKRSIQISQNYSGLFQAWELREIECLIKSAQRNCLYLRSEEVEDLLQECLVHWIFMKEQYRPDKGACERTFLNRVIRHKLSDIIRVRGANKRKVSYMSESLDAMKYVESDDAVEESLLVQDAAAEKISAEDLPCVMARAMAGLSFRQKQLCQFLMEGRSIKEAGEKMNIPRTTLNDEVKRIREVFRQEGLEEYLL